LRRFATRSAAAARMTVSLQGRLKKNVLVEEVSGHAEGVRASSGAYDSRGMGMELFTHQTNPC
jgi:hypothetical protein